MADPPWAPFRASTSTAILPSSTSRPAERPPSRPRLGIAIAPAHVARRLRRSVGLPERDGLLVRGVEDESPASRAGIQEGDLIVAVGGNDVTDGDALVEAIAAASTPYEIRI